MCFISRRPLTYHVIIIINRKELYDFYYTAITLTTGYKYVYKHYYVPPFSEPFLIRSKINFVSIKAQFQIVYTVYNS